VQRQETVPTIAALRRTPLYSEELGIELRRRTDREYFKWFLASLLFGGRISEILAKRTYRSFARERLLSPAGILRAGWSYLVNPVMRNGGYVRYDESKSRQILRDCETLLDRYGGSLGRLHREAEDSADLEARLESFYGVGPVTTNIFLRELRPVWRKADPEPLPVVCAGARRAGIDLGAFGRHSITFTRIEAGLIRMRHGGRAQA
jgi:endonuclease III